MKSLNLLLSALILFCLFVFTSCAEDDNTCLTCLIKDASGNVIKEYDQKCGTTTDVNNYEASAREDVSQITGIFSCTNP
jgi:hypothetical protein